MDKNILINNLKMNVLDLLNELDSQKIPVKGFSVDLDKKQIELSLKRYDLKEIFDAELILKKHSTALVSQGFGLSIKYEILIK